MWVSVCVCVCARAGGCVISIFSGLCSSIDSQPVYTSVVSKTLADSCRSLSRAVWNVVRGRPLQPATSTDVKY